MPPRRVSAEAPVHKLDEISQAIGRVDAYVHEYRHGINNIAQQINAMELSSEKRHTSLKLELTAQIEKGLDSLRIDLGAIAARVAKLEEQRHRQEGAIGVFSWLGQHWPFTLLATGLATFIAWATGKIQL